MIEFSLQPFFEQWLDFFTNPQKRIYWLYLITAFLIGFLYLFYQNNSIKVSLKTFFSYTTWCSKSARTDYLILFLNSFFMFIISSKLLSKSIIAFFVYYTLSDIIPSVIIISSLQDWHIALLFTLTLFILEDFTKYWVHRWLHTVSFLWPFHRVHHSATTLNFFTVFRTHPIEAILFSLRNAITQGIIVGLFFFLFGNQVTLLMVLGANAFNFTFNILGSNLRHSPISVPYPNWLERYFISPSQHHIHHSNSFKHKDKNFGIILSCWDRWFGSFCHSKKSDNIAYGVHDSLGEKENSLSYLYIRPFINSFKRLMKR